jgi:DNA-binding CsgD family transcriptional regulator
MDGATILKLVREIEVFEGLGALAQAYAARMRLAGMVLDVGGSGGGAAPAPRVARPIRRGRYELTTREREVLELLAVARSDGEIAEALFISKKTAAVHVGNIKGKLGADSRVGVVTIAMRLGLVPTPGASRNTPDTPPRRAIGLPARAGPTVATPTANEVPPWPLPE